MRTQPRAVAFLRTNRITQDSPDSPRNPAPGTGGKRLRYTASLALTTLLLLTAVAATPSYARAGSAEGVSYKFEITGISLPQALRNYAQVSGQEIIFTENLFDGTKPVTLKGDYTAETALNKLLSGTNLTYQRSPSGAIMILPRGQTKTTNLNTLSTREEREGAQPGKGEEFMRTAQNGQTNSEGSQNSDSTTQSAGTTNNEQVKVDCNSPAYRNDPTCRQGIQEIVVTAQKREERLIDVPISIVALGTDELQKRKVTSLEDLSFAVPGLAIQNNGGYQRRITLRGIGNVFGQGSLIGMYLDEAPVTAGASTQLDLRTYDLERVEVLRGPQGTLYGEGSVGGTIRLITKKPALNEFTLNADVAALFMNDGEPGQRIDAALNVPLIENELGLRIVGTYDRQGGWIEQPAVGRTDINDQDVADIRVKGLWQPNAQFVVDAMAVIHRGDVSIPGGEDANGNFTQTAGFTDAPSVDDDYNVFNLTLAYDFAIARLLSTTSYLEQDKKVRFQSATYQLTPPPSARFEWNSSGIASTEILTQEIRLTSTSSGPLQWTIGSFYRDYEVDSSNDSVFELPGVFRFPIAGKGNSKSKSWAVFGDASYRVSSRLTLGAGLRYFDDDQESATLLPTVTEQAENFDSLNPRLYAQYKWTSQVNTYVSAAKGFRSGGFNGFGAPKYGPESVWTYELGTKLSLAEGRLSTDVALFHSDYEDYQSVGLTTVGGVAYDVTSNSGSARIRGVEWGIAWHPIEQWTLGVSGTYVDAEFDEVKAAGAPHAVGDPVDFVPKYGYTLSAQHDFTWAGRSGFARLDYNEQGRSNFGNRFANGAFGGETPWYHSRSDVINLLNVNLGLQWSESLSLEIFGQNLLNDRGLIDAFDIQAAAARARPRTYGIQFGVTFR